MRTADENKRQQGSRALNRTEDSTGAQNQNTRRAGSSRSKQKRPEQDKKEVNRA